MSTSKKDERERERELESKGSSWTDRKVNNLICFYLLVTLCRLSEAVLQLFDLESIKTFFRIYPIKIMMLSVRKLKDSQMLSSCFRSLLILRTEDDSMFTKKFTRDFSHWKESPFLAREFKEVNGKTALESKVDVWLCLRRFLFRSVSIAKH